MESRWEGILASIFNGFWWIFGSKLGGKMEPRSIQEGIEKAMEKWIASREEGKGEVGGYQYTTLNHLSPGAGGILIVS